MLDSDHPLCRLDEVTFGGKTIRFSSSSNSEYYTMSVFSSWGVETVKAFGEDELAGILEALEDERYGIVLRAKGIVPCVSGGWIHFDFVPGEADVRFGSAAAAGRLCVIGSKMNKEAIISLFM